MSCSGGQAYASNRNGRTFCFSNKYVSFTYAPDKVKVDVTGVPGKGPTTTTRALSSGGTATPKKDRSSDGNGS